MPPPGARGVFKMWVMISPQRWADLCLDKLTIRLNTNVPYNQHFYRSNKMKLKIMLPVFIMIFSIFPALHAEMKIPVNAKVTVYWRYVPAHVNPIDIKSAFDNSGDITAIKTSFGDGGITGNQVVTLIKKKQLKKKVIRYRALSLKNGDDPSGKPSLASIVVRDDESYYDNYIIKNRNNELAIYIDVITAQ